MKNLIILLIIVFPSLLFCQISCNWEQNPIGPFEFFDIDFINTNTGWITARSTPCIEGECDGLGYILKTTDGGYNWCFLNNVPTIFDENFRIYAVDFINEDTGWIAGEFGSIYKTGDSGENWNQQSTGTNITFYDIKFVSSNVGWAVGAAGTIKKTTNGGANWLSQASQTTSDLHSIFMFDSNNGWVAGNNGIILRTTDSGNNWIIQSSETTNNLNSVFFINLNIGWVVGDSGTIIKTTNGGNNWIVQASGNDYSFRSVYFTDMNHGWIAGGIPYESGIIKKTTNGGNNWTSQNLEDFCFNSIYFTDNYNGCAVSWVDILKYSCNYSSQTNELPQGWSTISSYINPEDTNIQDILFPISDNLVVMKNGAGEMYIPEYGVDLIHNWDISDGYQLYMTNPDTLTITGNIIEPENTPLSLNAGWNLISYLRSSPMAIEQALSGILNQIIVVKDNYGGLYIPGMGINLIGNMQPGQGYHVYLSEGAVLTYPGN